MERILVVDDIEANRNLLKKTLVAINEYEVVEAGNGKEAITQFENEAPDLILMDINMPDMDGYQAASAIKSITGDNYIPIIFVTALSAKDSLSSALASGGDDFIGKPFDMEVLASKVSAHLRIRELNKQLNEKNNKLVTYNQQLSHQQNLIEHFFVNALQQSFLDKRFIQYHMSSMSTFNGDLLLVERGPRGGMYVIMGDFTGHGLTAAMGTLPVAVVFFKLAKQGAAISEIARELNCQLNMLLPPGMFLTATLLEINSRGDVMTSWMGGMPEIYWLGSDGDLKSEIHSQHMPLGILSDIEFDDSPSIFTVQKGDTIYLCSDGITEAQKENGEMFGEVRLKEILTTTKNNRFDELLKELKSFTGDANQNDDITFVEVICDEIPELDDADEKERGDEYQLPWQLSFPLSTKDMRDGDPVTELSNLLGSIPILKKHKGVLRVLLSEMYSNALDYSILGLNSLKKVDEAQFADYYAERKKQLCMLSGASIVIEFRYFSEQGQQYLQIEITDNGKGYAGHEEDSSNEQLRGRGLNIISSFCEDISFSNDGRTLQVSYPV